MIVVVARMTAGLEVHQEEVRNYPSPGVEDSNRLAVEESLGNYYETFFFVASA